jgi:dTDP-glucose 4,6-dehydratase
LRPTVRLGSLEPRRDLTYVKDTVSGFLAIVACDAALGRVVNIGRGADVSIGDLVERIAARLERPIRVETDTARVRPANSEVGRLLAGTNLARELWGWSPRYTLDEALDETVAWVREHLDMFRVDDYAT